MKYSYITLVFPFVTIACLLFFFIYYYRAARPQPGTLEWIQAAAKRTFSFTAKRFPMEKRDTLPILLITVIYAVTAFTALGDNHAPQSFHRFTSKNTSAVITLDEKSDIGSVMFYTGLFSGNYKLETSPDGITWTEHGTDTESGFSMGQSHADLFKWRYADLKKDEKGAVPVRFLRITADRYPMELGEVALYYSSTGELIPPEFIHSSAPELFDEQNEIPPAPSYMNSMYFDEIYHGRTAYEHILGEYPYEVSHPPLGKLILSLGISLFGMTAFGWRFMGTLFGVLMIPIFYIFIKNMFGKTPVAACGSILFAFDFMHFTQTRIATIDTYSVFFIILMYFFMYRYVTLPEDAPFRRGLLPLFLCGLSFGVGAACKWTSIYAGLGLALLLFWSLFNKGAAMSRKNSFGRFVGQFFATCACCCVFFIAIPAVIYCLSYIPYGLAKGMTIDGGMLTSRDYYKIILDNQEFMFRYHSKLDATHSYQSRWYEWILDLRPILYYRDYSADNTMKAAFSAFGNPIVWWGGLGAIGAMVYQVIRYKDGKALFILIGYFSQLAPWFFIQRCTFVYHYFPSTVFLVLALSHVFNTLWERRRGKYRLILYGYTASAVALFAAFYPALTGVWASVSYLTHFLRWIPGRWPI